MKLAIAQVAPVLLDRDATTARVAARRGVPATQPNS